jgi:hypothetical protein
MSSALLVKKDNFSFLTSYMVDYYQSIISTNSGIKVVKIFCIKINEFNMFEAPVIIKLLRF